MPNSAYEYVARKRIQDIEAKKYYCIECDKAFRDVTTLRKHLNTRRHVPVERVRAIPRMNTCECCNYSTRLKQNYNRHMRSSRHLAKVP